MKKNFLILVKKINSSYNKHFNYHVSLKKSQLFKKKSFFQKKQMTIFKYYHL